MRNGIEMLTFNKKFPNLPTMNKDKLILYKLALFIETSTREISELVHFCEGNESSIFAYFEVYYYYFMKLI